MATREDFDRLYAEELPRELTAQDWMVERSAIRKGILSIPLVLEASSTHIAANFAPPELVQAINTAAKSRNIPAETVDAFWQKTLFPERKNLDPRLTDAEQNDILETQKIVSYGVEKGYYADLFSEAPPNSRWRKFTEALNTPKDTQSRMH